MSPRASLAPRLILVALSTLVALAGAEVVARFTYGPGFLSLVDPYEHHPYRPYAEVQDVVTGLPIITNSLGWKDEVPRRVEPRPAATRVVVLGDSFAEGLGLPAADTIPAQLGRRLAGSHCEVLNGGRVSYSPLLEYQRLRRFLAAGNQARIVVVMPDLSDPQDDLFYAGQYETAPDGTPLRRRDSSMSPVATWLYNRLALLRWVHRAELRWSGRYVAPGEAAHQAEAIVLSPAERAALAADPLTVERYRALSAQASAVVRSSWIDHPPSRRGWAAAGLASVTANLGRIHDLCRAHDMTMLLVLYPSPLGLYVDRSRYDVWRTRFPRWFGEREQVVGDAPGDGALAFRQPLHAWAEARGVAVADLWPSFLARDDAPDDYLPGDLHFNARGAARVADELAPRLAELARR